METTIKLQERTKSRLDEFRQYKNESYDEVVRKIIQIVKVCKTKPKLSQQTLKDIEEAREQIKKGEVYTEEEAKKILGL